MKLSLMPPFIFQPLRVVVFTYSNKYDGCSTIAARVNGTVYNMYGLGSEDEDAKIFIGGEQDAQD